MDKTQEQLLIEGAKIIDKASSSKAVEVAPLVDGELVPIKGVWFRVMGINHVEDDNRVRTIVTLASEGLTAGFVKRIKRTQAKHARKGVRHTRTAQRHR